MAALSAAQNRNRQKPPGKDAKRLIVLLSPEMHLRIRTSCASRGIPMTAAVREVQERRVAGRGFRGQRGRRMNCDESPAILPT
jgi:hypothetical protein